MARARAKPRLMRLGLSLVKFGARAKPRLRLGAKIRVGARARIGLG